MIDKCNNLDEFQGIALSQKKKRKEASLKDYIPSDSIYVTVSKWQIHSDREQISGRQG